LHRRAFCTASHIGWVRCAIQRVTDKMPLNIVWAGLIHAVLPRATLIHCRRTPIDIAISIHRTYFNPYTSFPTGGDALVAAIRAVERLTAHWRRVLPLSVSSR